MIIILLGDVLVGSKTQNCFLHGKFDDQTYLFLPTKLGFGKPFLGGRGGLEAGGRLTESFVVDDDDDDELGFEGDLLAELLSAHLNTE